MDINQYQPYSAETTSWGGRSWRKTRPSSLRFLTTFNVSKGCFWQHQCQRSPKSHWPLTRVGFWRHYSVKVKNNLPPKYHNISIYSCQIQMTNYKFCPWESPPVRLFKSKWLTLSLSIGIHFRFLFQSKSAFAFTQNPPNLNQFGEASELRLLVLEANNISFKGTSFPKSQLSSRLYSWKKPQPTYTRL